MARTALTVQEIGANGGELEDIAFTAGDAANDHEFVNTGKELVIVNLVAGVAGALTVTPIAPADPYGRSVSAGDRDITTAAGEISIAGPFDPTVFNSSGNLMYLDLTDATNLTFAVVRYKK